MGSWLILTRSRQILTRSSLILICCSGRSCTLLSRCRLWVSSPARHWSGRHPWSPDYGLLFLFEVKFFVFDVRQDFLRVAAGGEGVRGVTIGTWPLVRGHWYMVCMALRSSSMSFLSRRRTRVLPDLNNFLVLFLSSGGDIFLSCCTCFFTLILVWLGFDFLSNWLYLLTYLVILMFFQSWPQVLFILTSSG